MLNSLTIPSNRKDGDPSTNLSLLQIRVSHTLIIALIVRTLISTTINVFITYTFKSLKKCMNIYKVLSILRAVLILMTQVTVTLLC